jgi:hypothetical protein
MIQYDTQFKDNAGEFYLPDTGKWFTFCQNTDDAWGLRHDLIHKIDTIDGYRCGIVRKGVAYIAVDENEYGAPVLEKWNITKRREFQ